jgi:glycosyltransferase involved in cell wall biosynthesis
MTMTKEIVSNASLNVLVVARWPLGGIRTYMLYMFRHFPAAFRVTVLAVSTHEDDALRSDCSANKVKLLLVRESSNFDFIVSIYKLLKSNRFDVILSQGFISAVAVYWANLLTRVPHILTIHGIVEPKYLAGRFGWVKRTLLGYVLWRITLLYVVSKDILDHLYSQFSQLRHHRENRTVIIPNGVELPVLDVPDEGRCHLREKLEIGPTPFLFGFCGRFMPQKGFDLLVEAVALLQGTGGARPFVVVAVGSGDYVREYQENISIKGLGRLFCFLPFQTGVHRLFPQLDALVIPSRWEACPLLPMEALCIGTPLIVSDCIGLRETVAGTPARMFPSEDTSALAGLMLDAMQHDSKPVFQAYTAEARQRYDIQHSARQLVGIIQRIAGHK